MINKQGRLPWFEPCFLIFLIGVIVGIASFLSVKSNQDKKNYDYFIGEVEQSVLTFKRKIEFNQIALQGLGSFHKASDSVTRQDFKTYVSPILESFPFIQALEWAPRVLHNEKESFESIARKDKLINFQIKEKNKIGELIKVDKRLEYFPIFFIEPLVGNEKALGFDLGSNKTRLVSLNLAKTLNTTIATGKISLIQDKENQHGFLIFTPIYRNSSKDLLGFVLGAYHINDMINKTLKPFLPKGLKLSVHDETDSTKVHLFGKNLENPKFEVTTKINFYGRSWLMKWQANHQFKVNSSYIDAISFGGGIFFIFLIFAVLLKLYSSKTAIIEKEIQLRTKELLESRLNIDEIMKALDSSALISETDYKGRITHVNKKFIEVSGFSEEELLGKDHRVIKSDEHPKEFFKEMWHIIKTGKNWTGEVKNKKKNGGYYWVSSTIYPKLNSDGNIKGFVSIRYDITGQKNAQLEIIEARDNAILAERGKTQFLANMSHEIRTPMNGVLGMVQLLDGTSLTESQKDMVDTIRSSGDSLLSILNDILDISKIDSGKIELEIINFDLKKCIESAIFLSSFGASQKNINLIFKNETNQNLWFLGDVTRIRQILINFLSNAVKFTEKGGVELSLEVLKLGAKKSKIKIHVKDSGIGIPIKDQKKLFKAFSQADSSTTRKYGGTGLGLSICGKLASIMGGRVILESKENIGSTFTLELDLDNGSLEQIALEDVSKASEEITNVDKSNFKILVVEDNKVNQKLAIMMLKRLGYSCDIAGNGFEAIAALRSLEAQNTKNYDLIFMDLQMPEMDGITATKKIVELYPKNRPKIMAMTANAFADDKKRCFEVGMDGFITKPVKMDELGKILDKLYK